MGIFPTLKINSLRKKIEDSYQSKISLASSYLNNIQDSKQKTENTIDVFLSIKANYFVVSMNYSLFHPDNGVFRNDISSLDEYKFDQLYQIISTWFCWTEASLDSDGRKNENSINRYINILEKILGINRLVIMNYFNYLSENPEMSGLALYRWCMLCVGHIDRNYEAMHENSQDCQNFFGVIDLAQAETEKQVQYYFGNQFKCYKWSL